MKVSKISDVVILECEGLEQVNDDMIDDISRMNNNAQVMVYYKSERRLVLQGKMAEKIFEDTNKMLKLLEGVLDGNLKN